MDYDYPQQLMCCWSLSRKKEEFIINISDTPGTNNLFRKCNARDNEVRHENGCVKSSTQLRGEHCLCSSNFFPSECPGLC